MSVKVGINGGIAVPAENAGGTVGVDLSYHNTTPVCFKNGKKGGILQSAEPRVSAPVCEFFGRMVVPGDPNGGVMLRLA